MPNFTAKLHSFELDARTFSETVAKDIGRQIVNAAKEFVKIAKLSTPIRTGFASGAFGNLEQAVGIKAGVPQLKTAQKELLKVFKAGKASSIPKSRRNLTAFFKPSTKESFRKLSKSDTGGGFGIPLEYYTGAGGKILKTPQAGRQFSTPTKEIFRRNGFVFTFTFDINITYFNINDPNSNSRTPSAPWKAFERGRQFFYLYLQRHAFDALNFINDFIGDVEYSVSGGQVSRTVRISKSNIIQIRNG